MSDSSLSGSAAREQKVEIGIERIELRTLMRAINRMQEGFLEISHEFYEEDEPDEWTAVQTTGGRNDRQWETIESAPTLVGLLTKLGARHVR